MKKLHQRIAQKRKWYKEWHENPGYEFIHLGFAILIVACALSILISASNAASSSVAVSATVTPRIGGGGGGINTTVGSGGTAAPNVVLIKNTNVRLSTVVNKETLLGTNPVGAQGVITAGPISGAENTVWWKVDFATGYDGWVSADNFKKVSTAAGATTVAAPATIETKQTAILIKDANIRKSATVSKDTLLGVDPLGTTGVVVAGPFIYDSKTWWVVDFATGYDGWVLGDNVKVTGN